MSTYRANLFLLILIFAVVISGCSYQAGKLDENSPHIQFDLPEGENLKPSFTDARLAGMKGIAENKHLQLYINDQTGEIAVIDKSSGAIWRSNPPDPDSDPIAAGVNKDLLSAQVTINFYNVYGQASSVNSNTDSAAYGQTALERIPSGVRVSYKFGKDEKTIDDLPEKISKERFENLLLSKLDDKGKRALNIAYREDKENGVYIRSGSLQGMQLKRALEAFESAGYTEEDLAFDIAENNLSQSKPIPRLFCISIEYVLDGDNLVVRVPVDSIRYPNEYPINWISVLNFFGAGGPDEKGSLFVPDGPGALIHFNNDKSQYPPYRQNVYGIDRTVADKDYNRRDQEIRMPVFGIIKQNAALMGIIEQGAAVAFINADVNGRVNSFNCVYPAFYIINKDDVTLEAEDQKRTFPRFQDSPVKSDFVIRYAFLDGESASYQGMAAYYRQYLIDRKLLVKQEQDKNEDSPFYLHLVGSITRKKHFIGIPYRHIEPLTTLDEAKLIISQLKQLNVSNIKLKYSGWFNKGYDHTVPKSITVNRSIGGEKSLDDFYKFAGDQKISFYPDIAVLSVNNGFGFNAAREASRRLSGISAVIYPVDMAMNRPDRSRSPSYVLSPRFVEKYTEYMLKSLSKYQVTGISLRDLANQLNSDYRRNNRVDRTESEAISIMALQSINEQGLKIMADGANAYAWPYLTDITNVPLTSSRFKVTDETIPFYQMVIRGFIEYSGSPYNLSAYTNFRQYVLKCMEYGSNVYFTWIYKPNYMIKETEYDYLYSVHYSQWIDLAEQMYHDANKLLTKVRNRQIISHRQLEDGVYRTDYENGVYVIVNYNTVPVLINGNAIDAEGFFIGG